MKNPRDLTVNENALRVGAIALRYQEWEEKFNKAAKHLRVCKQCKQTPEGDISPCPNAPPFPPIETFDESKETTE